MKLPFTLPDRPATTMIRGGIAGREGAPPTPRIQSMRGFEPQFVDIVDYIVRITDEIWEDRDLGRIYDTYATDCVIYSGLGTDRGVEQVVAGTIMGINGAPDGDTKHISIAWSGDDTQGFYTSHLGSGTHTNIADNRYGPASGKSITRLFVADCVSLDNKIHTEWLMHDSGSTVRQMGLDMQDVARRLADLPAPDEAPWRPERDAQPARTRFTRTTDQPSEWAEHHFQEIWNRRMLGHVGFHYAPDAVAHWCGGHNARGVRDIQSLILSLLASVPDSFVHVDHVCWSHEADGVILAVRWMLEGQSKPGGLLGKLPGGKSIAIVGASHFRFDAATGMIAEEWTVFDEVAALVAAYRG